MGKLFKGSRDYLKDQKKSITFNAPNMRLDWPDIQQEIGSKVVFDYQQLIDALSKARAGEVNNIVISSVISVPADEDITIFELVVPLNITCVGKGNIIRETGASGGVLFRLLGTSADDINRLTLTNVVSNSLSSVAFDTILYSDENAIGVHRVSVLGGTYVVSPTGGFFGGDTTITFQDSLVDGTYIVNDLGSHRFTNLKVVNCVFEDSDITLQSLSRTNLLAFNENLNNITIAGAQSSGNRIIGNFGSGTIDTSARAFFEVNVITSNTGGYTVSAATGDLTDNNG